MRIRPVILSGGSGTRLWPVSRKRHPKQFAHLVGDENLFTGTLRRTHKRAGFLSPIIIGNIEHRFLMQESLDLLAITDASLYLEPIGRNTLIAILIGALAEHESGDVAAKPLHLVMPSDHVITEPDAFAKAVELASAPARAGKIVLFGIEPSHPDSGFGYIIPGGSASLPGVQSIKQFCEKPTKSAAAALIENGALWNGGIFVFDPEILLAEAASLVPTELAAARQALADAKKESGYTALDLSAYERVDNQPFDRAIMEKTDKGAVVHCDMGWSDLGSWEAMWEVEKKDARLNVEIGSVVSRDASGCYIRSYGPTIAAMGVSDLMIVATKDSVLIAPRARAQEVRELAGDVGDAHETLALEHPRVMRPWGSYEGVAQGDRFQVKHIVVLPGRSLSLQMHHHRTEHWIVVAGTAEVECNDVKKLVFANESIYIPSGAKHRLSNPGKLDLHLIEVQSGDYLGEDDIVRFEDSYGRVT